MLKFPDSKEHWNFYSASNVMRFFMKKLQGVNSSREQDGCPFHGCLAGSTCGRQTERRVGTFKRGENLPAGNRWRWSGTIGIVKSRERDTHRRRRQLSINVSIFHAMYRPLRIYLTTDWHCAYLFDGSMPCLTRLNEQVKSRLLGILFVLFFLKKKVQRLHKKVAVASIP